MNESNQNQDSQQLFESARAAIREGLKKAGDIIEAAGDKVEHSGFKKLGDWIEKMGDSIEHLGERDDERRSSSSGVSSSASSSSTQTH